MYLSVNTSMKTSGGKVVNLVRYLCTQKVIVFTSEIARILIKPRGRLNRTEEAVDVTLHVVHRLMKTENATVGHSLFCTIFGMYII